MVCFGTALPVFLTPPFITFAKILVRLIHSILSKYIKMPVNGAYSVNISYKIK